MNPVVYFRNEGDGGRCLGSHNRDDLVIVERRRVDAVVEEVHKVDVGCLRVSEVIENRYRWQEQS